MMQQRLLPYALIALSMSLGACGVLPPSQEMSDVRQLLQAAGALQAEQHAPYSMQHARDHLKQAREQLEKGHHAYSYARFHALAAKQSVREAHHLSIAFQHVEKKHRQAAALGVLWLPTEKLLSQARSDAHQGNVEQTLKQLAKIDEQLQYSLVQYELEQLRLGMHTDKPSDVALTPEQTELYNSFKRPPQSFENWLKQLGIKPSSGYTHD